MLSFSARLACAYSAVSAQLNMLGWVLVERPRKVCAAPYLLIRARLAPGPESRAGSETRPWVACAALDENAKAITEASLQTPISTPGGFVGTPEFASPEQFAGVGVGIRSDSLLAVTLWEMLTGTTPFRGIPGEVMCQHQHAPYHLNDSTMSHSRS